PFAPTTAGGSAESSGPPPPAHDKTKPAPTPSAAIPPRFVRILSLRVGCGPGRVWAPSTGARPGLTSLERREQIAEERGHAVPGVGQRVVLHVDVLHVFASLAQQG